ncbi:MAG: IS481 family transposase [Nocardioidaceae bacterium]
MSKARVAVLKVITKELTVTAAAAEYGFSRQHLHRLLARYRAGGLDAVEPRSRRPMSNSAATPQAVRERIIELRLALSKEGWDAGPVTIAWHLEAEGHRPPSTSTIRRILHQQGLIIPAPRKRPKSSYRRFTAAQPNECWQSDFTHWALADGTDAEILNWLDDHSRKLLGCTAHTPVTGDIVVEQFLNVADQHGLPAATLTDNGSVYTSRFTGGKNAFEYLITALGIRQKNGHPGHPQTQGKVERFHQTLKKHLAKQPPATTIADLQHQLDAFRDYYNHQRPHREIGRRTPTEVYNASPKAAPAGPTIPGQYRLRYDRLDQTGKMSIRRAGRMHHLGCGRSNAGKRVLAIADNTTITVIELITGEILSSHLIDPDRNYWRNQQKTPGRWPEPPN